jgi:hypothetical protein
MERWAEHQTLGRLCDDGGSSSGQGPAFIAVHLTMPLTMCVTRPLTISRVVLTLSEVGGDQDQRPWDVWVDLTRQDRERWGCERTAAKYSNQCTSYSPVGGLQRRRLCSYAPRRPSGAQFGTGSRPGADPPVGVDDHHTVIASTPSLRNTWMVRLMRAPHHADMTVGHPD